MAIEIEHVLGSLPPDPVGPDRANPPYTQLQWDSLMAFCDSLALEPKNQDGETLVKFYRAYRLRCCRQLGIVNAEKIASEIQEYMSQVVEGLKGD